jgi:genome maintenance exonuclease 1
MRNKYFTHNLLPRIDVPRIEIDGKRFYQTPTGEKYRSVTTVLSNLPKEGLDRWRARVGEEEAQRVMNKAAKRGTKVHTIMEDYVNNLEDFALGKMPTTISLFLDIQPFIDKSVDEVFGIEYPLYSHTLKSAGTSDLICRYDGKLTILDYKTSNKQKKEEWIENYFVQSTAYAIMVEEIYGMKIEQIVIMIAVDDDKPQVFIRDPEDFRKRTIEIFNTY